MRGRTRQEQLGDSKATQTLTAHPAEQAGHSEQVREADPPALTTHRPEARHRLLRGGLGGHLQLWRPAHRADGDQHHHRQEEPLPDAVEGQGLGQHAVRGQPQRHTAGCLCCECAPDPLPHTVPPDGRPSDLPPTPSSCRVTPGDPWSSRTRFMASSPSLGRGVGTAGSPTSTPRSPTTLTGCTTLCEGSAIRRGGRSPSVAGSPGGRQAVGRGDEMSYGRGEEGQNFHILQLWRGWELMLRTPRPRSGQKPLSAQWQGVLCSP